MYDELLKFAVQLAKAAGGIQLAYFRGDRLSIETKSNVYDVVTRADRESEELIAGMIAGVIPTMLFWARRAAAGATPRAIGAGSSTRSTARPITVRDFRCSRFR